MILIEFIYSNSSSVVSLYWMMWCCCWKRGRKPSSRHLFIAQSIFFASLLSGTSAWKNFPSSSSNSSVIKTIQTGFLHYNTHPLGLCPLLRLYWATLVETWWLNKKLFRGSLASAFERLLECNQFLRRCTSALWTDFISIIFLRYLSWDLARTCFYCHILRWSDYDEKVSGFRTLTVWQEARGVLLFSVSLVIVIGIINIYV